MSGHPQLCGRSHYMFIRIVHGDAQTPWISHLIDETPIDISFDFNPIRSGLQSDSSIHLIARRLLAPSHDQTQDYGQQDDAADDGQ